MYVLYILRDKINVIQIHYILVVFPYKTEHCDALIMFCIVQSTLDSKEIRADADSSTEVTSK